MSESTIPSTPQEYFVQHMQSIADRTQTALNRVYDLAPGQETEALRVLRHLNDLSYNVSVGSLASQDAAEIVALCEALATQTEEAAEKFAEATKLRVLPSRSDRRAAAARRRTPRGTK